MAYSSQSSAIQWAQLATPSGNPASGYNLLYPKSDGRWYSKDSSGIETLINNAMWTKHVCVAATTANIATLAGGAPNTLDGVTLALNDRILVKNQTTASQNGIYTVTTLGTGSNGSWTRSSDADTALEIAASQTSVISGTANGGTQWTTTFKSTDTLATTAMNWAQVSSISLPITVAQGGTGQTTLTSSRFLVGNGTSAVDLTKVVPTGAVVGDTDAQTLTSKTLTDPKINGIFDTTNSARAVSIEAAAASVNYLRLGGNITGQYAYMVAGGTDANIPLVLGAKGTGTVHIWNGSVIAAFTAPASAVNYLSPAASVTGSPVSISTAGTDTNISLNLIPKGTGTIQANGVQVADISSVQVLSNKTISAPVMTQIWGDVGVVVEFGWGSTPVNHLSITPADAGANPVLGVIGTNTNIGINLVPKGSGEIQANGGRVLTVNDIMKADCQAATTANITTLAGGAPSTVDGVSLGPNYRVLVKNQSTAAQNGIYTVTTVGTGANGTWARATDADTAAKMDSARVVVAAGTNAIRMTYRTTFLSTDTLGTTALNWLTGPQVDVLTSGTSWTKPVGAKWIKVECVGGGGAGGGAAITIAAQCSFGTGGGGGGYASSIIDASTLGATVSYAIGAGGTGVSGGTGNTGGTTNFNSSAVAATGGAGGTTAAAAAPPIAFGVGGAPGAGSAGQVQISGSYGGTMAATTTAARGGQGGTSGLGFGGASQVSANNAVGGTGRQYGGGGGGSANSPSQAAALAGGAGAAGVIVITTYFE